MVRGMGLPKGSLGARVGWGWWPSGTPSLLSRVGGLAAPTEVSILTTLVVSKRFYSVQLERNKPSLIILWRGVPPRLCLLFLSALMFSTLIALRLLY